MNCSYIYVGFKCFEKVKPSKRYIQIANAVTFGSIWQYGDSTVEIYVKWNSSKLSKFLVEIEILNLAN